MNSKPEMNHFVFSFKLQKVVKKRSLLADRTLSPALVQGTPATHYRLLHTLTLVSY